MNTNETQIVCVAKFIANEGEEEKLLKNLHSLIKETKKEGGCLRYELNQNIDDPKIFTFIEKWYNQATLDEHCKKPHLVKFLNDGKPEFVKEFELSLHKEILD